MAIVRNDVADKNECKNTRTEFMSTSLKVKPLNKITQTKPQKIRARKLENGIALKMARIAFKFKTRIIDYNTLKESVAKIGHSNLIQKYVPRCHRRQENSVQERAFHSGFLDNEKKIAKQNFILTIRREQRNRLLIKSFFEPVSRQLELIKIVKRAFPT